MQAFDLTERQSLRVDCYCLMVSVDLIAIGCLLFGCLALVAVGRSLCAGRCGLAVIGRPLWVGLVGRPLCVD